MSLGQSQFNSWVLYTNLAGGFCRHCEIFELMLSEKIHTTVCEYSKYFLALMYNSETDPSGKKLESLPLQHMVALKGSFPLWARLYLQSKSSWSQNFYRVLEAIKAWRLPYQPSSSLQYLKKTCLLCFWWLRTAAYPQSVWNLSIIIYIKESLFTLMPSSVKASLLKAAVTKFLKFSNLLMQSPPYLLFSRKE